MMKTDYLWDKTGSDAEIEALENSLLAFRLDSKKPPTLRQKDVPLAEKRSYRFIKLGFALAVGASFIVVATLGWLRTPTDKPADHESTARHNPPENGLTSIDPTVSAASIVEQPAAKPAPNRARQTLAARPVKALAHRTEARSQPLKLTPAEKHAYDQLMLALSITSNELRIVKDTIYGREERNAANERQK